MPDLKLIFLSTLYVVLAFVLVSLAGTYNLTKKLFPKSMTDKWGPGFDFSNKGFIVHTVVFSLLVALPMFFCKNK